MNEAPYGSRLRPAPTDQAYLNGLRRIKPAPKWLPMLAANLNAPDHSISATEMAEQVFGLTNYGIANINYGKLASALATAMSMRIPTGHHKVTFLARIEKKENGEFEWILHSSLVAALRLFGL